MAPITTDLVICAKPGQIRHTKFPFKCYYLHMTVSDSGLNGELLKLPHFLKVRDSKIYNDIFEGMYRCYDLRTERDEILLQSLVLRLIHTLLKEMNFFALSQSGKEGSRHIHRALKFIKENITEDLTLERVAREVSLSPVYFHNSFKAAVGQTLREYVEEIRIRRSINLLMTTDMTLTEIAYQCGFSSQSYFSYVFKRKMKSTPREYIRQLNTRYEL